MTNICVYRKNKDIVKYTVSGHTGFGESGEDIICAAVSTITTAVLNGLADVVGIAVGCEVREAYLECVLPDELSDDMRRSADVLLNTMFLSLKDLEEQYGDYITITELEV